MRLAQLRIKNLGCIGPEGIAVSIDKIVVLIGPNNVGKSTVLDAYEYFASASEIPAARFHNGAATIEIEGVFVELEEGDLDKTGTKWTYDDATFGRCLKFRYVWSGPGLKGAKQSWSQEKGDWIPGGMGGWDSLIQSCMPAPMRIRPEDDSAEQEKAIVSILTAAVKDAVTTDGGKLQGVLDKLNELAAEAQKTVSDEIVGACQLVEAELARVFPGHRVAIEPGSDRVDAEKLIAGGTSVTITPPQGSAVPLIHQGTGLKRAFLWSAIAALAERAPAKKSKKATEGTKKRILLIDEPECFLHPSAVRSAREAMYALADLPDWQVLASTHSPIFIDVSKPHTTICRLDRAKATATFSSAKAGFSDDDRDQLRMIRACNPWVSEFFFADHTVLVEGETEHAVLAMLLDGKPTLGRGIHVVNCMGKANIPLFARILNHFGKPYSIIHDSDSPRAQRKGDWVRNGMWKVNEQIRAAVDERAPELPKCSVIVSVPDFENHYFGTSRENDKPYAAIRALRSGESVEAVSRLNALVDRIASGDRFSDYMTMGQLKSLVGAWVATAKPNPPERWYMQD